MNNLSIYLTPATIISMYHNICSEVKDLKKIPCIFVSSKEQRFNEQEFYQNTLNFEDNFLLAENLEEARLMVAGNQGLLPIGKCRV
ncbi:hypothetical protein PMF13cell1_03893 [Blautia producta]|uniref:Uncharacterized protein n=1 Tax=Blautia producta TaxID=33035 RepID=A0A4P6M4K8_9FIRM|nr:hypothetical protein PMF13cell1_03893 [Blautia producta]